ncbi:MAG: hypothetical protein AAF528_12285 [Cyanobacteria bacterium P01_C01_bin.121]
MTPLCVRFFGEVSETFYLIQLKIIFTYINIHLVARHGVSMLVMERRRSALTSEMGYAVVRSG